MATKTFHIKGLHWPVTPSFGQYEELPEHRERRGHTGKVGKDHKAQHGALPLARVSGLRWK